MKLVAQAAALEAERFARPSHVSSPGSGTLTSSLEPHLEPLFELAARLLAFDDAHAERCLEAQLDSSGAAPAREPLCAVILTEAGQLVRRVLASSRAKEGGLPEGMRYFEPPDQRRAKEGSLAFAFAFRVAAVKIASLTASEHVDEAVDLCLDGFAFSRDLAASSLLGAVSSDGMRRRLVAPCARAFDVASTNGQAEALDALQTIDGSMPRLSTLLTVIGSQARSKCMAGS